MPNVIHTFCHICEQVCGLTVTTENDRIVSIRPDEANPFSWRDYCIKGARAGAIVHHPARIVTPMKRVGAQFVEASYEEAVSDIAERLRRIIDRDGPDAVGCYIGNPAGFAFSAPTFLTGLMDAIGTRSRFTVGSIDQNAIHVTMRRMFGSEWLGLVPDVDSCDCLVLVGANPAVSMMNWFGKVPNGWNRILARVKDGGELIVIDPRRTETAKRATLYIAPLPEEDWALLLAMIAIVIEEGLVRIDRPDLIQGFGELSTLATSYSLDVLAARCGVAAADIQDAALRFGRAPRAAIIARTGPAQGLNGALAEWLSQALNLITGRIESPGGRFMPTWPVSLPKIADTLFPPFDKPSRVRGLAPVGGGYALAELPDEIRTPGPGQVRAFFLNAGNPVASGPNGAMLDKAFAELDLLVSLDLFQRESHRHSHWLIPAVHFLERGETHAVLASLADRPFLQTGRAALPPPASIRPEWEFFRDIAAALDHALFDGATPEVLEASLLSMGGLVTLDDVRAAEHGLEFAERSMGGLWTYLENCGRRAELCPPDFASLVHERMTEQPDRSRPEDYPYRMISRRRKATMNSWLADTAGADMRPDLSDVVEMCEADGAREGLTSGDRVAVRSQVGALEATIRLTGELRPGVVVIEHGWGSRVFDPSTGDVVFQRGVMRNSLVSNRDLDPLTNVPRLNGAPVRIEALQKRIGA